MMVRHSESPAKKGGPKIHFSKMNKGSVNIATNLRLASSFDSPCAPDFGATKKRRRDFCSAVARREGARQRAMLRDEEYAAKMAYLRQQLASPSTTMDDIIDTAVDLWQNRRDVREDERIAAECTHDLVDMTREAEASHDEA